MMRGFALAFLVCFFSTTCLAADDAAPVVTLHRKGAAEFSAETQAMIAAWSARVVESSSFSTANRAKLTVEIIAQTQDHYREVVAGDYVVVVYEKPITVNGPIGKEECLEIIVGLGRNDEYPSGVFTVDPEGRVVSYEKYGLAACPLNSKNPRRRAGPRDKFEVLPGLPATIFARYDARLPPGPRTARRRRTDSCGRANGFTGCPFQPARERVHAPPQTQGMVADWLGPKLF